MICPDAETLKTACEDLAQRDPILARAYRETGLPNWRTRTASYETLARIVVYQLISTKAADAIWHRVAARYASVTADAVLSDDADAVLACGVSRPKLRHLLTVAEAVQTKAIDFEKLAAMPLEAARKPLLAVRGIGPWTAETFLMTALGHLDAFPHGDVGLLEAYRQLSQSETRLGSKAFSDLAETWRPYRGVGAHLLYDWLNTQRDQTRPTRA